MAIRVYCVLREVVKDRGFDVSDRVVVGLMLEVERCVYVVSCYGFSWRRGRSSGASWFVIG